jgi:hypothetical protein
MKFLCISILLFFISFLSTPTVICLIDNKIDTTYFYSTCEEEENQVCFDEIKTVPFINFEIAYLSYNLPNILNISAEANLSFTNSAHQIFSPPPEII